MSAPANPRHPLKTQLLQRLQGLGWEQALLASAQPEIDEIIHRLEALNPIPHPLEESHWPALLGTWELLYASQGTVLTRQLGNLRPLPIQIKRIWQRLTRSVQASPPIATENGAVLSLPLVGEITAIAQGTWQPYEEGESANVSFGSFTLQSTRIFGIAGLHLPPVTVPVLDVLRREALWITSYLDEDLRFGRGATGNVFVFCRSRAANPQFLNKS
ncbi:MAG TPA: PAP fibrillin [Leptolyngbyaceae cyanobacterium M65_K2018_010]|nr:PAP fibrillin [Leptolyngbyaceae cyanobacterium M65_K2018_010]